MHSMQRSDRRSSGFRGPFCAFCTLPYGASQVLAAAGGCSAAALISRGDRGAHRGAHRGVLLPGWRRCVNALMHIPFSEDMLAEVQVRCSHPPILPFPPRRRVVCASGGARGESERANGGLSSRFGPWRASLQSVVLVLGSGLGPCCWLRVPVGGGRSWLRSGRLLRGRCLSAGPPSSLLRHLHIPTSPEPPGLPL